MKTPFERILIFEDKKLAREIVSDLEHYLPALDKVRSAYEKLELGSLDSYEYAFMMRTGINRVKDNFIKRVNKDLDALGVTSILVRNEALSRQKLLISDLEEAIRELRSFLLPEWIRHRRASLQLKHISYKDGKFVVSEDKVELIKEEYCRVYLTDEKQLRVYESLQKVESGFNELIDSLKEVNFTEVVNFNFLNNVLTRSGEFAANMESVKIYARGLEAVLTKHERFKNARDSVRL